MENNINNNTLSKNNENTIIFTIGRMNPPTTGHMILIRNMIEIALKQNLKQINIILSATIDNKTNPISCGEKRFFLLNFMIHHLKELMKLENSSNIEKNTKIDEMQIKIICMNDYTNPNYGTHPIFKSIQYILQDLYGYPREDLKMILVIGADRLANYEWIQKSLLERTPHINMEIVGLDRPEGAMSATYIRKLATDSNFEQFKNEMLLTGLDEQHITELYNEIKNKITPKRKKGGKKTRRKLNIYKRSKYYNKSRKYKNKK